MKSGMNLGIRAHDIGRMSAPELAQRVRAAGFSSVQLAPAKAIEGMDLSPGALSADMAKQLGEAFRREQLQIEVLGCYINPVSPDSVERYAAIERFKEYIRIAGDLGCGLVATETGSLNQDWSYHEGNGQEEVFQRVVDVFRELTAEAERCESIIGIEGVVRHVISTPQKLKRLLDDLDSDNVRVVFDPVNFLDMKNYREQDNRIREAVELFGDRIAVVHIKDFVVSEDGTELKIVAPGKGLLNYKLLMGLLADKQDIAYLLEDSIEADREEAARFLREQYEGARRLL